ncbi:serine-threonine protein kinase, putative [Entamoeba invadens IP1]|uniref:Serine-threonine protein kinase, putative n=1 Tax=Entamoeba invadens IP1 TaxID=370355 RepID=A0A0A1U2H0_ENTIV|nr:serine-threonine protein kinase, putative [Entamoeba invadens IP1]ELP88234.1 serine-threonine protein kinase, putative [Entamoeba invadens IP1]|eukprot:XP_004255005.1 serine-threonine protein kinase, putative [Entamoeba invadens IP1]
MTEKVGPEVYCAPEGIYSKDITKAYDIYSLAIIIVEAFQKRPAYSTLGSSWDVINFVSKGKRMDIDKVIPNSIGELVKKMWDQVPEKRPQIAEVLPPLKNAQKDVESMDKTKSTEIAVSTDFDIVDSILGPSTAIPVVAKPSVRPSQPPPLQLEHHEEQMETLTPSESKHESQLDTKVADDLTASLLGDL